MKTFLIGPERPIGKHNKNKRKRKNKNKQEATCRDSGLQLFPCDGRVFAGRLNVGECIGAKFQVLQLVLGRRLPRRGRRGLGLLEGCHVGESIGELALGQFLLEVLASQIASQNMFVQRCHG
eukprot:Lithocolla_globosa_v1_NODE_51_length_7702_cov_45.953507.p5 type:complete len:122 gc:universal NODE_51_length_7702_cov_45.953507:2482-2847(+)